MKLVFSVLLVAIFVIVNSQYVIQNTSYVVQTNVVHPPGGYPGYPVNLTQQWQPQSRPIGFYNRHGSHNLFLGNPGFSDTKVFHQTIRMRSGWLQTRSQLVKYPAPGFNLTPNITAIRIYDLYTNGNGGYANIVKGGIGFPNVTISLRSQRSHGYNFTIEIYGRR